MSSTELFFQVNDGNNQILNGLTQINKPFRPTPWLYNHHLQLLWLGMKKQFGSKLTYDRRDSLTMEDGGTTALHWLGTHLPENTPTLIVLSTITGSPHSMRGFVRDLYRITGWRIVFCERRGHGNLPVTSPKINTLGDVEDFKAQITHIQAKVPNSTLYAIGSSAGTGLLVRYLGEEGSKTEIKAAFAYCPGFNIDVAFSRADPFYSKAMTRKLKRHFIEANSQHFSHLPSYPAIQQSRTLDEFHRNIYECAGYASKDEYYQNCNPMNGFENISIPLFILNAADDPVCVVENVRDYQQAIANMPNLILALTKNGSHCAHFADWDAKPWAHQLAAQYFLNLHKQLNLRQ
ncbi:MAG: alpha/beta fold hydrolase [Pseudomonadales bacterium]|nr:alpha/beta fold hydrolase [Pseudomonadales bacterium]